MCQNSPVFIVGAARSGTTVLYEALAKHPMFSYVTEAESHTYLQDYWRAKKGSLAYRGSKLLKRIPKMDANPLKPSEANGLWIHHLQYWKYVTEQDVTDAAKKYFIKNICRLAKDKTFLNKNPHHCYRVRYLKAIWPNARFIHIVRDPRAVVLSEYKHRNRSDWDKGPVKNMLGEAYHEGRPFYNLAKEWQTMVHYAREAHPYELKYEHLITQPRAAMQALCQYLQVPFISGIVPVVQDMNIKFKRELSVDQITEIEDALQMHL